METIGISFAIPPALCELELNTFKKGILSSITFLGIASTSHVGGFLADEFGRKKTTFISLALSLFISALAALAPSYWMIVVLRFLSGMRYIINFGEPSVLSLEKMCFIWGRFKSSPQSC